MRNLILLLLITMSLESFAQRNEHNHSSSSSSSAPLPVVMDFYVFSVMDTTIASNKVNLEISFKISDLENVEEIKLLFGSSQDSDEFGDKKFDIESSGGNFYVESGEGDVLINGRQIKFNCIMSLDEYANTSVVTLYLEGDHHAESLHYYFNK